MWVAGDYGGRKFDFSLYEEPSPRAPARLRWTKGESPRGSTLRSLDYFEKQKSEDFGVHFSRAKHAISSHSPSVKSRSLSDSYQSRGSFSLPSKRLSASSRRIEWAQSRWRGHAATLDDTLDLEGSKFIPMENEDSESEDSPPILPVTRMPELQKVEQRATKAQPTKEEQLQVLRTVQLLNALLKHHRNQALVHARPRGAKIDPTRLALSYEALLAKVNQRRGLQVSSQLFATSDSLRTIHNPSNTRDSTAGIVLRNS